MPDTESMGLSLQVLDLKKTYALRPTTLLRALPCACVKEMAGSGISGVIGGEMVEDIACLNKYKRMAGILDMDYKDLHLNDITPPALPFLQWIYVETVQKPDTIDHSEYNASESSYQKTAIYMNPDTKSYIKCKSYTCSTPDESKLILCTDSIILTRICQIVEKDISSILSSTPNTFIRYAPIYSRNGTLVYIDNVGYLVLRKWDDSDIKITMKDSGKYYFNPNTMSYLAVTEGIDINEDQSYMTQLQCDYATYVDTLEKNKIKINNGLNKQENYNLFKSVAEIKVCLSSREVESNIVPIGSLLYIDISHQSLPQEIIKKLRFCKALGNDKFSKFHGSNVKHFKSKTTGFGKFCPVIECMLLYEMPESIVPYNEYCDMEYQVWVGIRQMISWSGKNRYTTRYFTIPTKALVCVKKLHLLETSLAVFQSIVS